MNGMSLSALILLPALLSAQEVETARVLPAGGTAREVRLPAELTPFQRVALRARVTGIVENVLVDRGSVVRVGDVLVELSAPEMQAQVAEAQARVRVFESQRVEALAKAAAARSTQERLKTAAATPGAVAKNDLVQAEKAAEAAEAYAEALVKSAEASRAEVKTLTEMQKYLRIRAPFPGVVTARLVHPGALAGPTEGALLELEEVARLRLVVPVPEVYAGSLPLGAAVPFTVPAFPGETFRGTVARKASSLDPKSRTMLVEADVANANGRLAPGMYADVQWPLRPDSGAVLVPMTSVVTTTERVFVIRVRDGKAQYVPVVKLHRDGDKQAVRGALSPGDIVVARGTDEIRDGSTLRVSR